MELRRRRFGLLMFALLFLFFFGFYLFNQRYTTRWIYWFDDWIFYADTSTYYSTMKNFSLEGEVRKHPLFSVLVHPMVAVAKTVFDIKTRQAVKMVIAAVAALNIALVFVLLYSALADVHTALLFTGFYGVLFSNLVFFSIPETYSLTNLGIGAYFILTVRFHERITPYRSVILGITAGLGALLNPPLGLLLFSLYTMCLLQHGLRQGLKLALPPTLVAVFIFTGANFLLYGFDYIEHSQKLVSRWASFSNYFDPVKWFNVGISFFIFGAISPLQELERSIRLEHALAYFHSPIKAVIVSIFTALVAYSLTTAARRRTDMLLLASVTWIVVLYLFYVYFNPNEAFLYSPQIQVPFILILATGFDEINWKWKQIAFLVFIFGVGYINMRCFLS
ncbi:MAG: hypothetical protein JRH18_00735 [Deltaproteobacteria bacterium]|nr:hypothetical protein [Deltaproteobacteria bacterium]MBW1959944.1 hypothetical protein [Deltaproteobacteria bacterium]MBW2150172.1 hypothetical protein [Deltaproteobacteria bacterium]